MNIGYIGLGVMGGALAERLQLSHPLQVFDLNPASVDRLVSAGAVAAPTLADMAQSCDFIFMCLPRSENVQSVIFGENGLASHLRKGMIFVDEIKIGHPMSSE